MISKAQYLKNIRESMKETIGYVWGGRGQVLTKERLAAWVKQYGRQRYYFSTFSAEKWLGRVVYDCSGYVLAMLGLKNDYNVKMIKDNFTIEISKSELTNGDLLYRSNFGHIGIYLDGGVVHAKGTFDGLVFEKDLEKVTPRFDSFGRIKQYNVPSHWAYGDLQYLESIGVVLANKDLRRTMTVGEFVAILARYDRARRNQ